MTKIYDEYFIWKEELEDDLIAWVEGLDPTQRREFTMLLTSTPGKKLKVTREGETDDE